MKWEESKIKEVIFQASERCKEKSQIFFVRVASFLKSHHDVILTILIPAVAIVFSFSAFILFVNVNSFRLFWLLLYLSAFLVLIYCFFWKRIIAFFSTHDSFFNLSAILIAVLLFAWQQAREDRQRIGEVENQFFRYEMFLREENNRNNSHLESILTDLPRNGDTMFWRDFSTRSYIELWDYIYLRKSQYCKNAYAALTIELESLNNINKVRREIMLTPAPRIVFQDQLDKNLINAASSAKPVLDLVIGNCQSFQ